MNISEKHITTLQQKILLWYADHKRDLPWRDSSDPYRVLVSEVMSQQTQVERVVPKFHRFLDILPRMQDLAVVDKSTLLGLWSGLGFNSRALRLQQAAAIIVGEYGGIVPADRAKLLELPGIGPYTSASICAFAYNIPEPVVDTNIRRVLIHELGLDRSLKPADLEDIARACIPEGRSNDRHNALMDYGSAVATAAATGIRPTSKQSTFRGSDREVRGWILKQLVAGTQLTPELISLQFPNKVVQSILVDMQKDGLITTNKSKITIAD